MMRNFLPSIGIKFSPFKKKELAQIGIDFDHSRVIVVQISKKKNQKSVTWIGQFPFREGKQEIASGLRDLFSEAKLDTRKVRIGLAGPSVITRFVRLPKMSMKELRSAMTFELEKYIPFNRDDVVVDYHILNIEQTMGDHFMKVVIAAVKKSEILGWIEALQANQFRVELVDLTAFACSFAFDQALPGESKESVALVDVAREATILTVLTERDVVFSREISYGGNDFLAAVRRKLTTGEPLSCLADLKGLIQETEKEVFLEMLNTLISEIQVSLNYYQTQNPKSAVPKKIFLTGELYPLSGEVSHLLQEKLGLEVNPWDPLLGIQVSPDIRSEELQEIKPLLPVSLGLALR